MIPLTLREIFDPRYPDFPIPRLSVSVHFEPIRVETLPVLTLFEGALVDSAAPYVVIPHEFHHRRPLKVYQELGPRPYRILSKSGDPEMQRFAEVGLRFLVKQPAGLFEFWPEQFVQVKAYLLDADTRPRKAVLFGLDALVENFVTHLEKEGSFLRARGND